MRVLMLGWSAEGSLNFGVGQAASALTKSLRGHGVAVENVAIGDRLVSLVAPLAPSPQSLSTEAPEKRGSTTQVFSAAGPYSTVTSYVASLFERAQSPHPSSFAPTLFGEVSRITDDIVARVAKLDFDLIHAHDWMTFPAAMLLADRTGKPLVVHLHSIEYDRVPEGVDPRVAEIERMACARASAVVAVSYYSAALLKQYYGVASEKLSVVHAGFYPPLVVSAYRRRRGLQGTSTEKKTVLFLGRLTFQKQPSVVIEAAALLLAKRSDLRFVIAGGGELQRSLEQRAKSLGVSSVCSFPGQIQHSEAEEYFSSADLYVMPSLSEPFGITALEALSFDVPVILSEKAGVGEVIPAAPKVPPGNVEALAAMIEKLLDDAEYRRTVVTVCRVQLEKLKAESAALKIVEVYRKVLRSGFRVNPSTEQRSLVS